MKAFCSIPYSPVVLESSIASPMAEAVLVSSAVAPDSRFIRGVRVAASALLCCTLLTASVASLSMTAAGVLIEEVHELPFGNFRDLDGRFIRLADGAILFVKEEG